ncbi:hypothetical protein [Bdellovibrio svalbardensis]|uniref:Uncharacterized protein n=1 Tax=Bdellovibrio svalbardensis TaxID=2972972 RepID=A0ABT6DJM1_9BACT|nr:hypothetical protein [Bdellovibrio svalbardensis]MDG0816410.1 hypothetical protein [Bdellovibrio svalbardensis]
MNKFLLCSSLIFSVCAQAQTSSSHVSGTENIANRSVLSDEIKNKTFQENTEITDAKLKADAGSLSRYSLKFNFTYNGPTLTDLSEKDQPNPDGSIGSFQTSLGGSIGARYRINSKSTVGISTGLKSIHPFHGAERTDLSNPSLTYDYSSRIAGIQMKNSPGFVLRTVPDFTKVGQYGMLLDNHSLVYDLGPSGFSIGTDMAVGYFLYNREYQTADGKAARYSFEFNPNLKYNFSDKLSFVFSSNISLWNPRGRSDQFALLNKSINQKLGLGYAYQRDIYINPFLTFYPQHLTWSGVTLNLTTIFSVF